MTCQDAHTKLSLYLYGELEFAEEEALEQHVEVEVPSLVTWIRPLLVPAQISPACTEETAKVKITPI
jgi:hypothetical protein